jgi:hypothetical protein
MGLAEYLTPIQPDGRESTPMHPGMTWRGEEDWEEELETETREGMEVLRSLQRWGEKLSSHWLRYVRETYLQRWGEKLKSKSPALQVYILSRG